MTRDELINLLPAPLYDLIDLPDPPTEMDLDKVLPILLDRSESMARALTAALYSTGYDVEPAQLAPLADLLVELVHAANVVFRDWNLRDQPSYRASRRTPPTPPAPDVPDEPDVRLPDPDNA